MAKIQRETERIVSELSNTEKMEMISDYEDFEHYGYLNNGKLCDAAEGLGKDSGMTMIFTTLLATECYRYFAKKYFDITGE